jgi:hypothetical protein
MNYENIRPAGKKLLLEDGFEDIKNLLEEKYSPRQPFRHFVEKFLFC